jgi:hypothetical protein
MRFSPREPRFYYLIGKCPVPAASLEDWAKRYDIRTKHVALTAVGGCCVSTIFMGVDHQYGAGPPLVFETQVFRGGDGCEQWRTETWDEAEKMHKTAVAQLRKEIKEKVND